MNLKEILKISKKDLENIKSISIDNINNNKVNSIYQLFNCIKINIVDWLELIDYINCNIIDNDNVNSLVRLLINLNINLKERLIHNLIIDYNINNLNVIKILEKNYDNLFSQFQGDSQKISVIKIHAKDFVGDSKTNGDTISIADNVELLKSLAVSN